MVLNHPTLDLLSRDLGGMCIFLGEQCIYCLGLDSVDKKGIYMYIFIFIYLINIYSLYVFIGEQCYCLRVDSEDKRGIGIFLYI